MDFDVREDRRPQGPRKLLEERELYLSLVDQGMSNAQACRIVGVHDRTGSEWRYGRPKGRAKRPRPRAKDASSAAVRAVRTAKTRLIEVRGDSRYLGEDERIHIADRLREKATVRAIAAELGRSPSTVSREIRRNRHPANGQYRPHAAHARARAGRPRPKGGKIAACPLLRDTIQSWLGLKWSPEQISRSLRRTSPASRRCTRRTRRSTRPSTSKAGVNCAENSPGPSGPAAPSASLNAVLTSVFRATRHRW